MSLTAQTGFRRRHGTRRGETAAYFDFNSGMFGLLIAGFRSSSVTPRAFPCSGH
jgi:hypothetical protein